MEMYEKNSSETPGGVPIAAAVDVPKRKTARNYIITFVFIALYLSLYYFNQMVVALASSFFLSLSAKTSPSHEADSVLMEQYARFMDKHIGSVLALSALLSLLMFAFIWRLRKRSIIKQCKLDRKSSTKDIGMGAALGFSVNFVTSLILVILISFPFFARAFEAYQQHISILTSKNYIPAFIGIGILVPVVEEILFRGMITVELSELFSLPVAMALQGLIFGLYHGNPIQSAYTAVLGFIFGYCTYKVDSLYPAIAAHIAMNSTSLLLTIPAIITILSEPSFSLLYVVVSCATFVCSFLYFLKRKRSPLEGSDF